MSHLWSIVLRQDLLFKLADRVGALSVVFATSQIPTFVAFMMHCISEPSHSCFLDIFLNFKTERDICAL